MSAPRNSRPSIAIVVALVLAIAACDAVVVTPTSSPATPAPIASPSASATNSSAGPSPSPTPIPLPDGFRPEGPWEVDFATTGESIVREVFVFSPRCPAGPCDADVVIQDFDGNRIATGVFRYVDGIYVFEDDRTTSEACSLSAELVSEGIEMVATTSLVLSGYRPAGTAVVSPRIQGSRLVVTRPLDARACPAGEATYTARGVPTKFAAARPTPSPTPKPEKPQVASTVKARFFGPGVTVTTYRVRGSTPYEITRSMAAQGPYSDWLGGSAAGVTQVRPTYRFHTEGASGSCRIVREASPAIRLTYTIVLPGWKAPAGVPTSTIRWWNETVREIARHEKVHVDLYRAAGKRLNRVLGTSTCANLESRLERVWTAVRRENCEFDMREYGFDAGLSMSECLAG